MTASGPSPPPPAPTPPAPGARTSTSSWTELLSAPTIAAMVDGTLTMTGPPLRLLRGVVSQGHKRYSADGFDLDLTYVLPRVIALGLPAGSPATGTWTGLLEPLWRNPLGEVRSLLDQYHSKSYLMINLCNERDYADADWPGAARVVRFPFDDHHPPALAAMQKLCELVEQFLAEDESRVVRRAIRPRNPVAQSGTVFRRRARPLRWRSTVRLASAAPA